MAEEPHRCHVDGCDSQAEFGTRFHITCHRPGEIQPLNMGCTIEVCRKHAEEAKIKRYLLSDSNREVILTRLTDDGYGEPNWISSKIEFIPIQHKIVLTPENDRRIDRVRQ